MALMPKDWIKEIDKQADRALKNNWSRFSLEWGKWSLEMNRFLRSQIEADVPEAPKLKFVFSYWVQMSQCIEMAHKLKDGGRVDEETFKEKVEILERIKQAINDDTWVLS